MGKKTNGKVHVEEEKCDKRINRVGHKRLAAFYVNACKWYFKTNEQDIEYDRVDCEFDVLDLSIFHFLVNYCFEISPRFIQTFNHECCHQHD